MDSLKIMTCGSVDDGKSTLLGRLIHETGNIYKDQSRYLESFANNSEMDYSLLLDGLIDEKEQGITIDIAFKYFKLKNKQVMLIDSPGHKEYTKNMANAATFADVALILVDISKGVRNQTKKHLEIVNLFPNIQYKIICINKMDKVNFSKQEFHDTKKTITDYCKRKDIRVDKIIPISAINGDNITKTSKSMKFYKEGTVFESLMNIKLKSQKRNKGSSIVRHVEFDGKSRRYFLENNDISFNRGDYLTNVYSEETAKVKKIYHNFQQIENSNFSKNTVVEFSNDISLNKGDSLVHTNSKVIVSNAFKAKIIWCSKNSLVKNKRYEFKFHSRSIKGFVSKASSTNINKNSISILQIETELKNIISTVDENYYLSQLCINDLDTHETVGFGYVIQNLDKGRNVVYKQLQNFEKNQNKCLWFTGLPASGKSSIASHLGKSLDKLGIKYYILDGDNLRSTVNKDLGFKQEDRIENNRRIAHIAKMFLDSGVLPIVTTISPNKMSRTFARSLFEKDKFSLIYVDTPLEECIRRDPKNLYNDKLKHVKNITGLHSNYDIPNDYELKLNTTELSIKQSVNRILKYLNI